ncbi:hypothetical protein GY45DRAFT_68551 [Cubamyces sp. BRFM 1775]|nr:hypothetical protein GY45DRAFT_68551 [Cubamyces sp. BRFM 1775]
MRLLQTTVLPLHVRWSLSHGRIKASYGVRSCSPSSWYTFPCTKNLFSPLYLAHLRNLPLLPPQVAHVYTIYTTLRLPRPLTLINALPSMAYSYPRGLLFTRPHVISVA